MLEELLKHDKLGNREELLFFLFDGLSPSKQQDLLNLQKYCTSQYFSIARSFSGILKLCEFISFIQVQDHKIEMNKTIFDPENYKKNDYFKQFHFYHNLISSLKQAQVIEQLFSQENLKFNSKLDRYYVLENKFPYKFFSIRNLLLSTGFFEREPNLANHLLIRQEFTDHFREQIIKELLPAKKTTSKVSLEELKKRLMNKEEAGKLAELFVLEHERNKLEGHPEIEKVVRIADYFTNAGYDIESFFDHDSIVIDKFIEVKSYEGEISFYWSKNEVEKAKELGGKYFLYLVDRSRMTNQDYEPKQFQNPYKKIFESDIWKRETENWKITFEGIDDGNVDYLTG